MALVWGSMFGAGLFSVCARADEWDKKTIITVKEPIQVRDTLLEPGQYVFRLFNSSAERHIVQIFNRDENHIISTVIAIPDERTNPTDRTEFTFWETPAGTARALRAWFYPGDTIGQEFPYPKQPLQTASLMTPPQPPAVQTPEAGTMPPSEPAPQPTALTESAAPPQTVETAQTTPPPNEQQADTPPPSPPPAQSNSADRSAPAELPKTGSPYPLIGLCGIVLVSASGVLRLKRLL